MAALTTEKAATMMKERYVNGKPITGRQRKFFGWVAGGRKKPERRRRVRLADTMGGRP